MIKKIYLTIMMSLTVLVSTLTVGASVANAACTDTILGIPAWYRGMQEPEPSCAFRPPAQANGQADARVMILRIGANVLQAALVIVGYVAVFFIIKGGFTYITSAGSSDGMSAAKKTITNAVVGLVIALLAASIVNAIAGVIK